MKIFETMARAPGLVAASALGLGLLASTAAHAGHRDAIVVPRVPGNLKVPVGNRVYLEGHALGTQDYLCMACPNASTPAGKCPASGFAWAFIGPQATLFDVQDGDDEQIITHFNSSNPDEAGKERPTWQSSRDTSAVWGNNSTPPAESSTDSEFVASDAIPWLLLPQAGKATGPDGGDRLSATSYIQRLETAGGVAPAPETCATAPDAGKKALVPYTANYFFYRPAN